MTNFVNAYYGGNKPASKEELEKSKIWIESLGDKIVNPGTPFSASEIVTSSGVQDDSDPNAMNGFIIFKADNMDAAVEIAKSDPFFGYEW